MKMNHTVDQEGRGCSGGQKVARGILTGRRTPPLKEILR
jgi:hypothetical protein